MQISGHMHGSFIYNNKYSINKLSKYLRVQRFGKFGINESQQLYTLFFKIL